MIATGRPARASEREEDKHKIERSVSTGAHESWKGGVRETYR